MLPAMGTGLGYCRVQSELKNGGLPSFVPQCMNDIRKILLSLSLFQKEI
jgi:hypothetical protein